MRAGDLRWIAQVQKPPTARLPSGAADPSDWQTIFTRRVSIEEVTGTKAADGAGQKQAVAYYTVVMRKSIILPTYRLVITGDPFDGVTMYITAVRKTLNQTSLTCVVRANQ